MTYLSMNNLNSLHSLFFFDDEPRAFTLIARRLGEVYEGLREFENPKTISAPKKSFMSFVEH